MSSALEIWNLALSHLGDKAGLSSVVAPYASREAQLCAQYWDIARRTALQKSKPSFARKRLALAEVDLGDEQPDQWLFAYSLPSNCIHFLGVYDPGRFYDEDDSGAEKEVSQANDGIIFTNVEEAIGKWIEDVETTGAYSPMFALGLSYLLASMVAGPLIKGKDGRALAKDLAGTAWTFLNLDAADDANQTSKSHTYSDTTHKAPWVEARSFNPDNADAVITRDED